MLELRPNELAAETPVELEAVIAVREAEIIALEQRHAEAMAGLSVTVDRARRTEIKKSTAFLGEQIAGIRTIVSLLRFKKSQAIANEALVARKGVPYEPLWPEQHFDGDDRRRVQSRGVKL